MFKFVIDIRLQCRSRTGKDVADAYGSQCVEPLNLEKMKLIKSVTSVVVLAIVMLLSATSANAQLKFGLKAGAAINDLKFSEDVFSM